MSRAWLVLACAACGAPRSAPPVAAPAPSAALTITPTGLGPITATTRANLDTLRKALAGYEVEPVNTGGAEVLLEYQVYGRDGEKMMAVIPDETGRVLNVHVMSPRVAVANHAWKVGAAFSGARSLTACECWGGNPICYTKGEHVAVAFERSCSGLRDPRGREQLDGQPISHTVWRPQAFGTDDEKYGGAAYGGGELEDDASP